ncbi:ATP-dependent zinc metalloprotease FtsH [uncultured Ezakiella sp.]|uniref:ATP-dependent zinc metalloprotease FtsH n=1 Tax=uncultured Ezakiella sp. TaxID=1637529 RepID=UPI0025F04D9E|nr:ATP-dependent zinc metalloprotease FtsH [uncultured Ezakiella sp.]
MIEVFKEKKPLYIYYSIVIALMLIFNLILLPYMQTKKVEEVGYSEFLTMLEEDKIKKVEVQDRQILFTTLNEKNEEVIYKTGPFRNNELAKMLQDKGVEFGSPIIPEPGILASILSWVIPIFIFILLGQLLSKQMLKSMGGGRGTMSFGKSNAKVYVKAETGKTFADVAGQDEAKEALKEIVSFLHNPAKYASIGATMPKGALLVGPPGTGKTLLAQAVAGEANVPFFSISGSEFVEMFVGMGAAKVRDLFKQANEKAPCIVFIDEIDTIGKRRDGNYGGNDEREQTLNQLLSEMDGFDGRKGVVILAATNRPETLDPALLRPGRFDRRIPVELPDLNGRIAILKVHARKVRTEDNIDFKTLGLSTAGASGADLANMINEGALNAVRAGRQVVTQKDIEDAIDVVIAGYERKSMIVSPEEKRIISYHEIGHAVVAAAQSHSAPVHKITIIPRTSGALGYTMQVEKEEKFLKSDKEIFNDMATLCGGRAAEELIFNTRTTGASNDIERVTNLARNMIATYGMTDEFDMAGFTTLQNQYLGGNRTLDASEQTIRQIDEATIALVKKAHETAINILKENMDAMHATAEFLLEKETITGDEFMEIFNRYQA